MLLWQHNVVHYRIERLEFFDEGELLDQLLQHYCLSCGANDALGLGECDKCCCARTHTHTHTHTHNTHTHTHTHTHR